MFHSPWPTALWQLVLSCELSHRLGINFEVDVGVLYTITLELSLLKVVHYPQISYQFIIQISNILTIFFHEKHNCKMS